MKEIEDLILEKEYFELNAEEKAAVGELVANEEEFAEMKWFLHQTQIAAKEIIIEPSTDLKAGVYAELVKPANKRIWLNGGATAGASPSKKKIYQLPLVQIGVAACLVVGFLLFTNPFGDENKLALNTALDEKLETEGDEQIETLETQKSELEKNGEDKVDADEKLNSTLEDIPGQEESFIQVTEEAVVSGSTQTEELKRDLGNDGLVYDVLPANDFYQNTTQIDSISTRSDAYKFSGEFSDDMTAALSYNRDERGQNKEEEFALSNEETTEEVFESDDDYTDIKNNDETNNVPSTEIAGGSVATGSSNDYGTEDSEKSNLGTVGHAFSKKKDEVSKLTESPAPVPNAVSIAETNELKSLFFTVP